MNVIYGLYEAPESAQCAYDLLLSAGVSPSSILVMSSEPFEEWEFGNRDHRSVISWFAIIGAAIGLTIAYLLTSQTQQAWPINTGGMPIVSNWTNLIIMFELTMLGAVLATVFTLLRTAGLPARLPAHYDPVVSEGRILIGAADYNQHEADAIERALLVAGPESIQTKRS
jgi:hypothetical protein